MQSEARIQSILNTQILDLTSLGFEPFYLSDLMLPKIPQIEIIDNLRLGHSVEKIVSQLIKASTNFKILYENLQIKVENKTIGEIDFIIEEIKTKQLFHIELAYKFYLLDPTISTIQLHNWIGPNRKDSLKEKIEKLRDMQFPLLYKTQTKAVISELDTTKINQKLCLVTSLYLPYESKVEIEPLYAKAVKGYFIKYDLFKSLEKNNKYFYIPKKKDWGISPSTNKQWYTYQEVEIVLNQVIEEKQAALCWQKCNEIYIGFFVVWW